MPRNKTALACWGGAVVLILATSSFAASKVSYDSGNRRDPFVPLSGEANSLTTATSSSIKLEGIIYDPAERSMAILNGKTYQVGEGVGGATILKILKDHVVISEGGEEKTLWIREEEKA